MQSGTRMIVLIILVVGILFSAWLCWRLSVLVSGPVERTKPVDFSALKRTGRPNDYLICPPGLCGSAPDETSPVFDVPVARLQEKWNHLISRQHRVQLLPGASELQLVLEQRSRLFGFPDTISVRFYPLGCTRSTLAVYSRSQYGYWDLGVNRRRVRTWLSEVERGLSQTITVKP